MTELQKKIINKHILKYEKKLGESNYSEEEMINIISEDEELSIIFYRMLPEIMDEYYNIKEAERIK